MLWRGGAESVVGASRVGEIVMRCCRCGSCRGDGGRVVSIRPVIFHVGRFTGFSSSRVAGRDLRVCG